ncbi:hypothetical protein [Bacillus mycoides]|uniref:hypothetical protein n=1 Tax=Bacillus mycoides TaxID=1405 RepID=UPI000863E7EE|nr:hypothetical protein [Bacillus mycoides]SCM88437.1 Uncharacterized protein BWAI21_03895 [Bacillus mycoides]
MISLLESSNLFKYLIGLGAAAYAMSVFQLLVNIRTKKQTIKKEKDNFYEILINGLEMQTINTIEDIYNIYKGINDFDLENENYRYNLNKLLRKFLVKLYSEEMKDIKPEQIKEWKIKIDGFIKKNEELSPFSELPPAERGMMNDIISFLDKSDNESIRRKLIELAGVIQVRKEELDKIENLNKWSIPLAIVGLLLTIIFGIASLI